MRPTMTPAPGGQLLRYVGDRLEITLEHPDPAGWRAFLRTNLTRAAEARAEAIAMAGLETEEPAFAGASWRDIALQPSARGWTLDLALTEVGHFRAKAYALDPEGRQHWPDGSDLGISVHPDALRTANTIYCAFPRLFGGGKERERTGPGLLADAMQVLDGKGYAVIPPSGTLRDLTRTLPHIFDRLGCRILHLLPIGPTPTVFARMGRFGSPYAQLDLTEIDPALVEFDRAATAEDQFRELACGVHGRDGRLFLDIVINHTGWGSRLMSEHPEWFRREADGGIHSPGAWGNIWADLAELDPAFPELWDRTAEALLTWCRRGVDGFRCDAGYMVPLPVWRTIIAKVRQEFPETVFLLEGLGGAWESTAALMGEGGMQWAYSELFQNHGPKEVSGYLDHATTMGARLGPLVHYSETHDNDRLAARGAPWSLLRNRLCALASQSGAWGFTCGVEWLASEKIDVHGATGLRWGQAPNLVRELAQLNALLLEHPCFFDGARLARLSGPESWVLAILRESAEGLDRCLVLVNLDPARDRPLELDAEGTALARAMAVDLLGQGLPEWGFDGEGQPCLVLAPGRSYVLAAARAPRGLSGDGYRRARAQAAWALQCMAAALPAEDLGPASWRALAERAAASPYAFLSSLPHMQKDAAKRDLLAALESAADRAAVTYPQVIRWRRADAGRITLLPPGHWLLVEDDGPFTLHVAGASEGPSHPRGVPVDSGFVAAIPPAAEAGELWLELEPDREGGRTVKAAFRRLAAEPVLAVRDAAAGDLALLTNGRGGYARLHADLARIESKYDALLAANLHTDHPSDRHVLVKRLRVWAIADGFLTALDAANLADFRGGPTARWRWSVNAGDGRCASLELIAWMLPGRNEIQLRFTRRSDPPARGRALDPEAELRLTLRLDLEDRGFHGETEANPGLDAHFLRSLAAEPAGFAFTPTADRSLLAVVDRGRFHPQPEWSLGIPHPQEGRRGMKDHGDAWSPGWFDVVLEEGVAVTLCVGAESDLRPPALPEPVPPHGGLGEALRAALPAFLAKRGEGLTVIAGYPWFLDWGRDTLIACRGLLAGGFHGEAAVILRTFAALLEDGTLPNTLNADGAGNRDSSDAPLWFALACEEAAQTLGPAFLDEGLQAALDSIVAGYLAGTPNGIRVDPDSGLVWSPSHFTWMDTNHPAGTPREGYPIEIQALWIRLLRQAGKRQPDLRALAARAEASLDRFWHEGRGCCADTLHGPAGTPAAAAVADDHLRPNQLLAVSLGFFAGDRARRIVDACAQHLLVPGALRSLAPLPVTHPLPIHGSWGKSLNNPLRPYWPRYEGDEDSRRKPAYHNGTAWSWWLPILCEAIAKAWPADPAARAAARSILGSVAPLLENGCLGQLPEILDGDAPHHERGCDAQAWSVSEALRVWKLLETTDRK